MDNLSVTLFQTGLHWQSIEANLAMLEEKLWDSGPETDLIILPEMFNTGFTMQAKEYAEPSNGKTHQWMLKMSRQFKAAITGSVITRENNDYFNRLLWVYPDGRTDYYDKRHLFRPGGEHGRFTQGRKILTVELKGWKIRPLVCYDLRFPVWSRNKTDHEKGALAFDLLVYSANWPAPRIEVWETLLRARAVENSSYCIGVSRTGVDGEKVSYNGHSMISDYRGRAIWHAGEEDVIYTTVLGRKELEQYRSQFPVHLDSDDFTLQY